MGKKGSILKKVVVGLTAAALFVTSYAVPTPVKAQAPQGTRDRVIEIAKEKLYKPGGTSYKDIGFNDNWCAYFAHKCISDAGVNEPTRSASSTATMVIYDGLSRYHPRILDGCSYDDGKNVWSMKKKEDIDWDYTPKPGDLVFFEHKGGTQDGPDHTALVWKVEGTGINATITTIEGNGGQLPDETLKQIKEELDPNKTLWYYMTSTVVSKTYPSDSEEAKTIWGYATPYYADSDNGSSSLSTNSTVKITAVEKSRARAVEEAASRMGKTYETSISFVKEVIGASKALSFSEGLDNNSITRMQNYYFMEAAYWYKCHNYIPRPGDIVLLETKNPNDGADRVAIVTGVHDGNVYAIGVSEDTNRVVKMEPLNKNQIDGYCTPYYEFSDLGDYNSDGKINDADVAALRPDCSGKKRYSPYLDICGDLNKDKRIDVMDLLRLSMKVRNHIFEAETNFANKLGRIDPNTKDCLEADTGNEPGRVDHLAYGPYKTGFKGNYIASFRLSVDINAGNDVVALIDVRDAENGKILSQRKITRNEFIHNQVYQEFQLPFNNTEPNHPLEFRVEYQGNSELRLDCVTIN